MRGSASPPAPALRGPWGGGRCEGHRGRLWRLRATDRWNVRAPRSSGRQRWPFNLFSVVPEFVGGRKSYRYHAGGETPCEAGEGRLLGTAGTRCRVRGAERESPVSSCSSLSPALPHHLLPCPSISCRARCCRCQSGWPWLARGSQGTPREDPVRGRRLPFSSPAASRVAQLSGRAPSWHPSLSAGQGHPWERCSSHSSRFTWVTTFYCPFFLLV